MKFRRLFITLVVIAIVIPSCSKTEDNTPLEQPITEIQTENLREAYIINQNINFNVESADGENVTDISTFFVNGNPINGSSFSSSVEGEFEMYATYTNVNGEEVTTPISSFRVIIPKQKIVVEDYTGTWCGWCPRVTAVIHDLEEVTEDIVVIAIHEEANNIPEPLHFPEVQLLKDAYNVSGFPAARINRSIDWPQPHPLTSVTSIAGAPTNLAIAINSRVNADELNVEVDVVYENGSVETDKLVVYLIENGVIADQYNYYTFDPSSPFYEMGNPIVDFEHNDGLRHAFTNVLGNPIPQTDSEYRFSGSFSLPANANLDNYELVAIVVDENNTAKNAQSAHLLENKPYE